MTLLRLCLAWLFIPVLTSHAQPGGFDNILADPTAQVGAGSKEVTATLVAAQTALVPGKPLDIALKLEHPEHWHTYWLNPGIGVPTSIKWDLPSGWSTTPLIWPVPKVVPSELGNQHIYEGTTWLFATVTPPADLAVGSNFTLKGAAKWLVCDEASSCNPGGASLTLSLPVAAAAEPVSAVTAELKKVQAVQAITVPAWQVKLDPKWNLTLTGDADLNPDPGTVYFFDHTKNITTDPQTFTREGNVLKASLKPADEESNDPPAGFLYAPKGWKKDGSVPALLVGEAPASGSGTPAAPGTTPSAASPEAGSGVSTPGAAPLAGNAPKIGFMVALASLFLAGMILNLMPCVFPVLALKVLSFARQAGKDPKETRKHSLAYTMGLLVFVWLVAGGMFVAKSAFGLEFAWGDITRYAGPIAVIVIILFLLGLNLAGIFEIGTSLSSVGGDLQDKKGYAGSFWSGALTMLISTPCSGPFMAIAMGYALQQPPLSQFLLFTSFALGIAIPYVVLSNSPILLKKLPRPGAWMETFKKALAFPMFGAAIFFYNGFAAKTGENGASSLLWALLLIALAAWIYGHWCVPSRPTRARWMGGLTALLITTGAAWFAWGASQEKVIRNQGPGSLYMTGTIGWETWSPELIAKERAKGRAIFVDYTTLNCPTCELNELKVFKSSGADAIAAKFKSLDVLPVRAKYYADDTPEDTAIRDSLKPWGISSFPVYVMYPANPAEPPFLVSSGVLSQSQVLEALARATKPADS